MADPGQGGGRGGRWADLRLRVISASILAPVALCCIYAGGLAWVAFAVVAALALGMEWADITGTPARHWPGMLVPGGTAVAALQAGLGQAGAALGVLAVTAALAGWTGGRWAAGGLLYIGLAVIALCSLRLGIAGRGAVLFLMLSVWASDIGAYAVGRIVGGARLAPAISPGKTWSGAVGGLVVSAALLAALAGFIEPRAAGWAGFAAAALAVASQLGDLFESWVKRRFGVKDSGWLIPGHGGVLDRLDGVLAAAPMGVAMVALIREGMWQ